MRGKEWLEEFSAEKHTMAHFSSLVLSHATIVKKQAEMGPEGFLGLAASLVSLKVFSTVTRKKMVAKIAPLSARPRLTLLILDATLWPSRG